MTNLVKPQRLFSSKIVHRYDVGLAGPGLHLDGEVAGVQGSRGQAVAELDGLQVLENLLVKQGEAVADCGG